MLFEINFTLTITIGEKLVTLIVPNITKGNVSRFNVQFKKKTNINISHHVLIKFSFSFGV